MLAKKTEQMVSGEQPVPIEVRRALAEALKEDARQVALSEDPVYRALWERESGDVPLI